MLHRVPDDRQLGDAFVGPDGHFFQQREETILHPGDGFGMEQVQVVLEIARDVGTRVVEGENEITLRRARLDRDAALTTASRRAGVSILVLKSEQCLEERLLRQGPPRCQVGHELLERQFLVSERAQSTSRTLRNSSVTGGSSSSRARFGLY